MKSVQSVSSDVAADVEFEFALEPFQKTEVQFILPEVSDAQLLGDLGPPGAVVELLDSQQELGEQKLLFLRSTSCPEEQSPPGSRRSLPRTGGSRW